MRKNIISKLIAGLGIGLISVSALAATPAAAREYRHGNTYRGYDYRGGDYRHYAGRNDRHYNQRNYKQARNYRGNDYRYRCRDNGTGGTIIGGVAGGLLGNEIAGYGDKTTGAILGAAVGALAGRAIDKSDGRRC